MFPPTSRHPRPPRPAHGGRRPGLQRTTSYFNRRRTRGRRRALPGPRRGGPAPGLRWASCRRAARSRGGGGPAAGYLAPSFFSLAFFCFCCMISESLRESASGLAAVPAAVPAAPPGRGSGRGGGRVGPALTSACGRRPRAHRPAACPCPSRSASSGSSAAPVRAGSRLRQRGRLRRARPGGPVPGLSRTPAPRSRVAPRPPASQTSPSPSRREGRGASAPARPALTGHGAAPSRPPLRRHVPHCPPAGPAPRRALSARHGQSLHRARLCRPPIGWSPLRDPA